MDNNRKKIVEILDNKPHLRKYLFTRGFLMTDKEQDICAYPFYGNWNHVFFSGYHFYIHKGIKMYCLYGNTCNCFLIGHAYNPFTMEIDENVIINSICEAKDENEKYDILNELTGVFTIGWISDGKLVLNTDCAGMQIAYYGIVNGFFYLSTHMQLIGDICNLRVSEYVKRLISYKFYHYYGSFLPGDLSSYDELKRIVPNVSVEYYNGSFSLSRFYPKKDLIMCKNDKEYFEKIAYISEIMRNNLLLISKKWNKPAISMSGGMDSKGSVAAANGFYEKFQFFSYISMEGEAVDAEAARKIANAINVEHRIDYISNNDLDFDDIDEYKSILKHNFGNIGSNNQNDVRKRVFYTLNDNCTHDIEVKSWVSEIGRANYYKKFGFKNMPKRLTPRQMTTMYKLFILNRKLVADTDQVFKDYIDKTFFYDTYNFDSSDMFLWEMRYGGWGGQVITCEHRFAFDITIPYNNRILMEAFLTLPIEKRISDQAHYDMIKYLNPTIDSTGITVTNYNETKQRMYLEKIYYLINTHLPF